MHATRKLRKLSTINRRFILSKTHLELHLLALFEGLCFKTNFARFILCHDSYEINIPKCHKVILYPYLTHYWPVFIMTRVGEANNVTRQHKLEVLWLYCCNVVYSSHSTDTVQAPIGHTVASDPSSSCYKERSTSTYSH